MRQARFFLLAVAAAGLLWLLWLVVVLVFGSTALSWLEDMFGDIPEGAVTIFNATDETITIVNMEDGSVWATLRPRETGPGMDPCNEISDSWVFEARLEDGTVVSTVPDEFCSVDPRWEITQAEVDATYPDGVIAILNGSDLELTIVAVGTDGESVYREVFWRLSRIRDRSECIDADLEARRADNGNVVASRPGPFCQGEPEWAITQEQVDAAAG